MNTKNYRAYFTPLKRVFVFLILLLMVSAFVAPIPISNAATTCDNAMTMSERIKAAEPQLGSFVVEETFEHDGVRMRLVVSGNAEEREDYIFAEFQQTLIELDKDDNEISRQITHRTMRTSGAPETATSPEEPTHSFVTASDWGTFSTYYWNSFKFMFVPGSSQQDVKYDHPDNYYTYHPEQWNQDWSQKIGRYAIIHASEYVVSQTQSSANLWQAVLSMSIALISLYGLLAAAVAMAIKILAVLLVFLFIYASMIWLWVELVWKTEQGDAWSYSYLGTNGWIQMSHGLWRNIWYYAYDTAGSL
ncbi:MAG: hypothetical protein ACTSPB_22715 [Candidatus Thorarchaeota archaeon]